MDPTGLSQLVGKVVEFTGEKGDPTISDFVVTSDDNVESTGWSKGVLAKIESIRLASPDSVQVYLNFFQFEKENAGKWEANIDDFDTSEMMTLPESENYRDNHGIIHETLWMEDFPGFNGKPLFQIFTEGK